VAVTLVEQAVPEVLAPQVERAVAEESLVAAQAPAVPVEVGVLPEERVAVAPRVVDLPAAVRFPWARSSKAA
jgi:hypothetical protein